MYALSDLVLITGLTERTLRTHLKRGILEGQKEGRAWRFTKEQVMAFLEQPSVAQAIRSHQNGMICDFLNDTYAKEDCSLVVLHLPERRGAEVSAFFCQAVNKRHGIRMRYDSMRGLNRVILVGRADTVQEILDEYKAL